MNKIINYFFDSLVSINKEKIILTTKEGKETAKEIKAYKGLDKELNLKEMYNICKIYNQIYFR